MAAVLGLVGIICALTAWKTGNRIGIWITVITLVVNGGIPVFGFFKLQTHVIRLMTCGLVSVATVATVLPLLPSRKTAALAA